MTDFTLLFHGTNRKYLDDQIEEFGEYIGGFEKGFFGECLIRKGIYFRENKVGMSIVRAIQTAKNYDSTPILLITSSELMRNNLQLANTGVKIFCGLASDSYLVMEVPVKNEIASVEYDETKFMKELKKLLNEQNLFTLPKIDIRSILNY